MLINLGIEPKTSQRDLTNKKQSMEYKLQIKQRQPIIKLQFYNIQQ